MVVVKPCINVRGVVARGRADLRGPAGGRAARRRGTRNRKTEANKKSPRASESSSLVLRASSERGFPDRMRVSKKWHDSGLKSLNIHRPAMSGRHRRWTVTLAASPHTRESRVHESTGHTHELRFASIVHRDVAFGVTKISRPPSPKHPPPVCSEPRATCPHAATHPIHDIHTLRAAKRARRRAHAKVWTACFL